MRWVKRSAIAIAGTAVLAGGPVAVQQTQIALLPAHEKLVVPLDRVVGVESISTTDVRYAYADKLSQALPDEDVSQRTDSSVTRRFAQDRFEVTFTEKKYQKIGGKWHDLAWATTTEAAYRLQTTSAYPFAHAQTTDTLTSSTSWVAPAGVSSVDAEAWAGGGGGRGSVAAGNRGGGGGGGAYAATTGITVVPGNSYVVTVGKAGTAGSVGGGSGGDGGDSMFFASSTLLAKGGKGSTSTSGGLGGEQTGNTGSVGTTIHKGGTGGAAGSSGGGGGGGAGDTTDGGNGSGATAGSGGTNGGGNGGTGASTPSAGSVRGGGGGGSGNKTSAGAVGARGEVPLTYTAAPPAGTPSHNDAVWFSDDE